MSNEITFGGYLDDPSCLDELEELLMDFGFADGGSVGLS
jgi:hypothetical protein